MYTDWAPLLRSGADKKRKFLADWPWLMKHVLWRLCYTSSGMLCMFDLYRHE